MFSADPLVVVWCSEKLESSNYLKFYNCIVWVFGTPCRNKAGYPCKILLQASLFCWFALLSIGSAFCFLNFHHKGHFKNYENISRFVEVIDRILLVFFMAHGVRHGVIVISMIYTLTTSKVRITSIARTLSNCNMQYVIMMVMRQATHISISLRLLLNLY